MKRIALTPLALVAMLAGVVCAAPARAQMTPWDLQAQVQLQLQWQRQQMRQQRVLQQQLRSQRSLTRRSTNSSHKAPSSNAITRQRAAEMRRILQLIRKEQHYRLALLRRITVARQTSLKRIQRAAKSVRPTGLIALQPAPTMSTRNAPQLSGAGQSLSASPSLSGTPRIPERTQMASLLNELAPLMFLHGRENPPVPSTIRPRPLAPVLVRVPELAGKSPARKRLLQQPQPRSLIVHKPAVPALSPPRATRNFPVPADAEDTVMQLVLRIAAGESKTQRSDRNEISAVQPDKIKQAPPRPALASEHPIPVVPKAEASRLAVSSRPSLVEVVRQAPPLPSLP